MSAYMYAELLVKSTDLNRLELGRKCLTNMLRNRLLQEQFIKTCGGDARLFLRLYYIIGLFHTDSCNSADLESCSCKEADRDPYDKHTRGIICNLGSILLNSETKLAVELIYLLLARKSGSEYDGLTVNRTEIRIYLREVISNRIDCKKLIIALIGLRPVISTNREVRCTINNCSADSYCHISFNDDYREEVKAVIRRCAVDSTISCAVDLYFQAEGSFRELVESDDHLTAEQSCAAAVLKFYDSGCILHLIMTLFDSIATEDIFLFICKWFKQIIAITYGYGDPLETISVGVVWDSLEIAYRSEIFLSIEHLLADTLRYAFLAQTQVNTGANNQVAYLLTSSRYVSPEELQQSTRYSILIHAVLPFLRRSSIQGFLEYLVSLSLPNTLKWIPCVCVTMRYLLPPLENRKKIVSFADEVDESKLNEYNIDNALRRQADRIFSLVRYVTVDFGYDRMLVCAALECMEHCLVIHTSCNTSLPSRIVQVWKAISKILDSPINYIETLVIAWRIVKYALQVAPQFTRTTIDVGILKKSRVGTQEKKGMQWDLLRFELDEVSRIIELMD